jgi:hypothetical protein
VTGGTGSVPSVATAGVAGAIARAAVIAAAAYSVVREGVLMAVVLPSEIVK